MSSRAAPTSSNETPPIRWEPSVPTWLMALARASSFSSSFRNRACSGESGMKKNAMKAMTIVGAPLTMNRSFQLSMAAWLVVIP